MKKLILTLALCLATLTPVKSAGVLFLAQAPSGGGGCSQATTFLARTSGLSGTESTAYTTMICGMVTDGTWGLFDALYIFATNTTTTANLNLVSSSFGITNQGGTPTFTADHGYTTSNTIVLNTNFTPSSSGVQYTLNSASVGIYDLTNDTSSNRVDIGSEDGTNFVQISGYFNGNTLISVNTTGFPTVASANSQGLWAATRTASNASNAYKNGSSTAIITSVGASSSAPAFAIWIGCRNASGVINAPAGAHQYSAVWIGAGLTGAQYLLVSNRINAYMTALGINVF